MASGAPGGAPPPPPNGKFIAAELRFGDKMVKGQPFSAERSLKTPVAFMTEQLLPNKIMAHFIVTERAGRVVSSRLKWSAA